MDAQSAGGFSLGDRVRFRPSRQGPLTEGDDGEDFYTPEFLEGRTGEIVEAWTEGPFLLSVDLDPVSEVEDGEDAETWSANPDDLELECDEHGCYCGKGSACAWLIQKGEV